MAQVSTLTPSEFVERWPLGRQHEDVVLLDVREQEELEAAALPIAKWIPMGEIPSRLGELDAGKHIVVMCHGGMRSMRVAQFLLTQGFDHVINLTGGIDAWSLEVDSAIPRY